MTFVQFENENMTEIIGEGTTLSSLTVIPAHFTTCDSTSASQAAHDSSQLV